MFLILPEKPYIYNNYFLHFIPYKNIANQYRKYITCQNPTYYPKKKRGKKPMDHFHTRTHKLKGNISPDIQENIKYTTQIMQDCNDLVQKQFKIGIDHEISIYIVYMDGLVNTEMLQESVIRPLLQDSFPQERTAISQYVIESADWKWIDTMEDAMTAVLSGNTILFLGGEARAILFSSKLFPTRGVQNADQEVAIVGPKDSFTESLRTNTALIRRRIRDTRLKVIQKQIGTRSKTDYALMYIEDLYRRTF